MKCLKLTISDILLVINIMTVSLKEGIYLLFEGRLNSGKIDAIHTQNIRLPNHCLSDGVFLAIQAAVQFFRDVNNPKRDITILSDSQADVRVLNSNMMNFC